MAMMTYDTPARTGLFSRVMAMFERRAAVRQTREELNRLSDRELADIGILRGDIHGIAHNI